MVRYKAVAKQYIEKELLSSSPNKVVLKLYEGSIGFLKASLNRLENNDMINKAKLLDKAVKIIDYLRSCLDMERGGEISTNLNKLYEYILLELAQGNLHNDANKIKGAIELLRHIRDGWAEICKDNIDKRRNDTNEDNLQETYITQKMQMGINMDVMDRERESFSAVA